MILPNFPSSASHESYLLEAFLRGPEATVGVTQSDGVLKVLQRDDIAVDPNRAFD